MQITPEAGQVRIVSASGARVAEGPLWRLRLRNGRVVTPKGPDAPAVEQLTNGYRITWSVAAGKISVDVHREGDAVALIPTVCPRDQDALSISCPGPLRVDPANLKRVIFPSDLGIALKAGFFRPQRGITAWEPTQLGPAGLERIAGLQCVLRPMDAPAEPVQATRQGIDLLGDELVQQWTSRPRYLLRPPAQQPEITLLQGASGAFLSIHRVGKGMLARFGGKLEAADGPLMLATVQRMIAQLAGFAPNRRRHNVVLIALRHGPPLGGWAPALIEDWKNALEHSPWFLGAGLRTRLATTPGDLVRAMKDRATFAIVNPYSERLPCSSAGWQPMADAIRTFLQKGGVWFETTGWPAYSAITPARYLSISTGYPIGFCDYARVDTSRGSFALYGVQRSDDPTHIFVPAEWSARGSRNGGVLERSWEGFAPKGGAWTAPSVRISFAPAVQDDLRTYLAANHLEATPEQKAPAALLDRWKRSLLINVAGPTFRQQAEVVDQLPAPAAIHLGDYLHGGFDKQLPDILPPNPEKGTEQDFRSLFDQAHQKGDLVIPYTNPTWWCDDPRGPTFQRVGEGPLLLGLDGKPNREQYGPNWGWSICPWHPEVLAATDRMWAPFVQQYPADALFVDQLGMRGLLYDLNPASPTPYAYVQGIMNLGKRMAQHFPIACEHGFDRLLPIVTEFRGLTWQLVPFEHTPPWLADWLVLYRDRMEDSEWEFYPLGLFLAHDRALFGHHGGGPFVNDREQLAWTMVLGYQISAEVWPTPLPDTRKMSWLDYLERLQDRVGSRLAEQPLLDFRYLAGSGSRGVLQARYGPFTVTANLRSFPYPMGNRTVAPMGFDVEGPGIVAGIYTKYGRMLGSPELWLLGSSPRELVSPAPEPLAGPAAAPAQRPPRTHAPSTASLIGVLDFALLNRQEYPWGGPSPEQWLDALAHCRPVADGWATVRRITRPEELEAALSHPEVWLAIVNPYAETLPVTARYGPQAMVSAIRRFVQHGGTWFENGGYPFWTARAVDDAQTPSVALGPSGLAFLGAAASAIGLYTEPGVPLQPTAAGEAWLGVRWAQLISSCTARVNRPILDPGADLVFAQGANGEAYLAGWQLGGSGWFLRFCGGPVPADVALPTGTALIERLFGAENGAN
ncbi:MAG: hypothetical protein ACP5VE_08210 [Chthonomonadales bacterium]